MVVADGSREPRRPWLAPAAILRRIDEMRASGGHRAAEMLLNAIGASRAAHEVAGVIEALDEAGATTDANRVLTAAVHRAPSEVAALFTLLRTLHREAALSRAQARAATTLNEPTIAAIAALLDTEDRKAFLKTAAEARSADHQAGTQPSTGSQSDGSQSVRSEDGLSQAGRSQAGRSEDGRSEDGRLRDGGSADRGSAGGDSRGGRSEGSRSQDGSEGSRSQGGSEGSRSQGGSEGFRSQDGGSWDGGSQGRGSGDGESLGGGGGLGELVAVAGAAGLDASEVARVLRHLEATDTLAAVGLADSVLEHGAAVTVAVLGELDDASRWRLLQRLAARPVADAAQVMDELVRGGRRSLSRAVAAAVPGGVDWPAETDVRVVIDLMVASAAHGAALAAVVDAGGPRGFVAALADEPAGVIAAVLTRACAADAGALVDEILDELARRADTVKWIARLWHLDPEPAASAGRRPDLVDRFLDLVVGYRSPQQVADLIRELDDGDGALMATRIMRLLLDDPARRWVRPYVGHLLGDSHRAADLCGGWTGDRAELARAAAVDELRRMLPEPAPVHSWRPALTLRAAERPLWMVRLGDLDGGSLIGLSDRGVHCHSAPGPLSGPRIQQPGREFRIDYEQFADLTFAFVEEGRRIRIAKADTAYYWAADHAAGAEARAVITLLNAVAAAVRAIYAVRLDEPLGPSATAWA